MRLDAGTVAALAAALTPLDTPDRRAAYRAGRFPRSAAVVDLERRYRWDLFYLARAWALLPDAHVTDAHIDTALRRVVPPLTDRG